MEPADRANHIDSLLTQASVIDEARRIVEVTIIKPGPSLVMFDDKPVVYPDDTLIDSVPLWQGAACFCDHWNKSVRNMAGVFFAPWYEDGVRAHLRFIDDSLYYLVAQIIRDRSAGETVPDIGLSADIMCSAVENDEAIEVTGITQVISADIVFRPAAGGSFDRILNAVVQAHPEVTSLSRYVIQHLTAPVPASSPLPLGEGQGEGDPAAAGPQHQTNASSPVPTSSPLPLGEGQGEGQGRKAAEELVPVKRVRDLQSIADRLRLQLSAQAASLQEKDQHIARLESQLFEAVIRHREGVLEAHPEIPEHLIGGATIAELDESLEKALALVNQVRQLLEKADAGNQEPPIPPGSPPRSGLDVSALTPRQKIEWALKRGDARPPRNDS